VSKSGLMICHFTLPKDVFVKHDVKVSCTGTNPIILFFLKKKKQSH